MRLLAGRAARWTSPAFYAYPEPRGFKDYSVQPNDAFYSEQLREFLLPYDAVRTAEFPDACYWRSCKAHTKRPLLSANGTAPHSNAADGRVKKGASCRNNASI